MRSTLAFAFATTQSSASAACVALMNEEEGLPSANELRTRTYEILIFQTPPRNIENRFAREVDCWVRQHLSTVAMKFSSERVAQVPKLSAK
jgi:hypothetical protein